MQEKTINLFNKQQNSLREPLDVISSSWENVGITRDSLKFKTFGDFVTILEELGVTLYVSREYENLLLSLHAVNNRIEQSCFPLPHPSGIAVNRENNTIYIASTRNPNKIVEFKPSSFLYNNKTIVFPTRVKYYCGSTYFHDLAIISNKLYANSVGKNAIIKLDMNSSKTENLFWWPLCIEKGDGTPDISENQIQLNSIAAGKTFNDSFFTASGSTIGKRKPGHHNYSVDKRGVIFSAKTRDIIATGLSRPHSAKLFNNKIWLNNSSYGEFGYIDNCKFYSLLKLPGWTRGLCIIDNIAFVGVSRILPRFEHYATGLKNLKKQYCGISAINLSDGNILGSIYWPNGNQIFGIDWAKNNTCGEFLYSGIRKTLISQKEFYFKYVIE